MSESTGAPAGAPAPAAPAESSPAPIAQTPISVSDAARIMAQRSREAAGAAAAPTPVDTARRPSANEMRAAPANPSAAPAPPAPVQQAPPAPAGLAAMEAALGLPGGGPPPGASPESTPSPPSDPMGGVEIDGRRYTTAELREQVLKAADYTRKTQELAAQRQTFEQQAAQVRAQQQALATVLPLIQPELARLAETVQQPVARPDLALLETNPQQYLREQAAFEHAVAEQQRLASLNGVQAEAQARALEQQVAAGNEQLSRELPFWGDPQQRLAVQQQIVEWATTKGGYSRDELRGLASPHHLKAMMKAALFDRWVDSAKSAAPRETVAVARGMAPPPAPSERVQAATAAFEAKADFRTGAALLAARRAATNGQAR